ncbi:DNA polymerase III subunit gamma/tau [Bacteroidetes/Chlorobi group bacterium ChocPot_Mid]|nr:MAG: DNA polymerase III subunit gamma/tau [Bacteroidetes/Chlorobi group bacterium ChocPot_Mid]
MNEISEYLVTARKWRPLTFKDVVGQEHITVTLQNAIKTRRIHHAYLFSGPRGVGKTTTARIYARAINCLNPEGTEPCNKCESCEAILNGRSMDIIEIDGASNNSVDDIRKLRENAKYPPINGTYKMYIIDEVHMLSTSAFNALLKTLEEPPPHLLFVFATTEAHKVLPTILSRCQRFDFRRMDVDLIVKHISHIAEKEKINIDEDSLISIARKADGSMRDAQSIFDQVVAFCGNDIKYEDLSNALHLIDQEFFFRISQSVREHDVREMFTITTEVINRGYDLQECMSGLLEHFRNILSVKAGSTTKLIEGSEKIKQRYKSEAELFSKADVLRFMNLIATSEQSLRFAPQPRIRFELLLVQMAQMDSSIEISKLIKELKKLKKKALNELTIENPQIKSKKEEDTSQKGGNFQKLPNEKNKKTEDEVVIDKVSETKKKGETKPINDVEKIMNGKSQVVRTNTVADSDFLKQGWEEFKKQYATSKYQLFVLTQSDIVVPLFFNGEIVLQCKSDFVYENISNKIVNLKEYLNKYYQSQVNVRLVMHDFTKTEENLPDSAEIKPDNKSNKENNTKTSYEKYSEISSENISPIEEALIDMFGAKQVKIYRNEK